MPLPTVHDKGCCMATQIEVPPLGESVTQAILIAWHKADGEVVALDEAICELETDKANVDVPAQAAGVLDRVKEEGDSVTVGEVIARIAEGAAAARPAASAAKPAAAAAGGGAPAKAPPKAPAAAPEDFSPAVRRLLDE